MHFVPAAWMPNSRNATKHVHCKYLGHSFEKLQKCYKYEVLHFDSTNQKCLGNTGWIKCADTSPNVIGLLYALMHTQFLTGKPWIFLLYKIIPKDANQFDSVISNKTWNYLVYVPVGVKKHKSLYLDHWSVRAHEFSQMSLYYKELES